MAKEDQLEILQEMLELSIKAGRRMYHDYKHMLSEVPRNNQFYEDFKERGDIWHSIFYSDNGMKNYRAELHRELESLEWQLRKAKEELIKLKGNDSTDDLPF